jgi:hypothetical protein
MAYNKRKLDEIKVDLIDSEIVGYKVITYETFNELKEKKKQKLAKLAQPPTKLKRFLNWNLLGYLASITLSFSFGILFAQRRFRFN